MNRRNFNKILTAGMVSASIPLSYPKSSHPELLKKGYGIKKGDVVGLITPGSPITEGQLTKAKANMRKLGLIPYHTHRVKLTNGYLAGTDDERLADINHMLQNDKITLIWAIRGGYGCTRILNHLPQQILKKKKKILVGYSDITALHCYYQKHLNLTSIHGPVASSEFTPYTLEQIEKVLRLKSGPLNIPRFTQIDDTVSENQPFVINPGIAQGKLAGGNLSLLSALCGTKHLPNLTNKLVFIEDVGEKPYRIDRMLTQLIDSTNLRDATGIVLGVFAGCETKEPEKSFTLKQMILDRIRPLGIPSYYGFSFGHVENQCSFPIGVKAELNTHTETITILDSPFK